jgi:hypothetical protein
LVAEPFQLHSEVVGSLPVINHFLARIGLGDLLERHLPRDDARLRLAPATVIGVVARNLIVAHRPVYALGEWAAGYQPGLLGLAAGGCRCAQRRPGGSHARPPLRRRPGQSQTSGRPDCDQEFICWKYSGADCHHFRGDFGYC